MPTRHLDGRLVCERGTHSTATGHLPPSTRTRSCGRFGSCQSAKCLSEMGIRNLVGHFVAAPIIKHPFQLLEFF